MFLCLYQIIIKFEYTSSVLITFQVYLLTTEKMSQALHDKNMIRTSIALIVSDRSFTAIRSNIDVQDYFSTNTTAANINFIQKRHKGNKSQSLNPGGGPSPQKRVGM